MSGFNKKRKGPRRICPVCYFELKERNLDGCVLRCPRCTIDFCVPHADCKTCAGRVDCLGYQPLIWRSPSGGTDGVKRK